MTPNRDFNRAAQSWDEEPRRRKLADEIAAAIKERVMLSPLWDALEIGCGTGLVTLSLAPYLRTITAVDSSRGMLDKLAEKLNASKTTNVSPVYSDPEAEELPDSSYHLIYSAMTLHHVRNPARLIASLATRVHPGGRIVLADLAAEDGSFHDDPTGVFHHGFTGQELTHHLEAAGFRNISVTAVTSVAKGSRNFPVLMALAA